MAASSRFFFHEKEKALTTFLHTPMALWILWSLILPSDDEENSIGTCLESLQGKDDYKNYLFVMIKSIL